MKWRTRFRRLSASEKHEVIDDIFGGETAYNKFYDAVAVFYRVAEFVFLAAALLFGVIYIASNADNIRYSQIEYLVQNFSYILEQNTEKRTYMTYERDGDINTAVLHGGLAVYGNTGISVYSATGVKTAQFKHGMKAPVAVGSDRYLLVYGHGGEKYRLYSSFSQMHEGSTEHAIYSACMSKNGAYALVTGSDDGSSQVLLFNNGFRLVNRFLKYAKVAAVALNEEGDRIAIVTVEAGVDGDFVSEVMFCAAGSETAERTVTVSGMLPLDCVFNGDSFILLGDTGAVFFDENGNVTAERRSPGGFDLAALSSECVLFVTDPGGGRSNYSALMLDGSGSVLFDGELEGTPYAVSASSGSGFILTGTAVVRISPDGKTSTEEASGVVFGDKLRAVSEREVWLCTTSHAVSLRFDG